MQKRKNHKGLIFGHQKKVNVDYDYWKFGIIKNNKKIIDNLLYYSSFSLGYENTQIIDLVCEKMKEFKPEIGDNVLPSIQNPTLNSPCINLADKLYEMSKGYKSIFTLSGSDGIEVAIKLAFAYHQNKSKKRKKIVSFDDGYHGATLLTSTCSDVYDDMSCGMEPYQEVIKISRDSINKKIDWNEVACIIVETCPHDPINPYNKQVWDKINEIQTNNDVVVIIDDIFMGGGKTGSFFGWDKLPISPDIAVMGKAITGGSFPLAVALYNDRIDNKLTGINWLHAHTYSFNLSGVICALEYIKILEKNNYMNNVDSLIDRMKIYLKKQEWDIIGNFGLMFSISKNDIISRFNLPLNPDDEYFNAMDDSLEELEKMNIKSKYIHNLTLRSI